MIGQSHPTTSYFYTSGVLMLLLAITVAVAYVPLGTWSVALALMIAAAKIALIGLFFMHLRDSPPLVALASAAGIGWLVLLFVFLLADYLTRVESGSALL